MAFDFSVEGLGVRDSSLGFWIQGFRIEGKGIPDVKVGGALGESCRSGYLRLFSASHNALRPGTLCSGRDAEVGGLHCRGGAGDRL